VSALLPAPRLAPIPPKPRAAVLAEVAGDELAAPLRVRDDLQAEAQAALRDLQAHRPGGDAWAEALAADKEAADKEAATSGALPKVLSTEKLLGRDGHRWAVASALCRALPDRQRAAVAELDLGAIAEAAWGRLAEAETDWTIAVVEAWQVREARASAGKRATAYEAALAPLSAWATAGAVWRWARGDSKPRTSEERDTLEALRYGFPGGPVGRRFWILKGEQSGGQPLTIPPHVTEDEAEVKLTPAGREQHARTAVAGVS
jgi:hypothetical protein